MANKKKQEQKKQDQKTQRQGVKEAARQAVDSGTYSKSNTQALKDAGVKSSNVQAIKRIAKDVQQTNRNATQARDNPIYQGAGFQDSVQNQQAANGTVGQAFFDSPEFAEARGDLTNQQVADYAMSQGYGLGDQWMKDFGTKTTQAQTLKEVMKGDGKTKLGALLKIAAGQDPKNRGQDLVDNKEFRQIYKNYDGNKSGLKITSKMDKINAKQDAKNDGYNPMGVQNRTLKGISNNKYGDARDLAWGRMANATFGDALQGKNNSGALSQLAMNYKGSALDGAPRNQAVYGADGQGNPIFAAGTGKSWADNKLNKDTTTTYSPWATDVKPTGGGRTIGDPPPPKKEEEGTVTGTAGPAGQPDTPGFGSGGMGDYGEKNALTFRQAKSRWKMNGRNTKGTSGLKYSRSAGFGGFGASAATF